MTLNKTWSDSRLFRWFQLLMPFFVVGLAWELAVRWGLFNAEIVPAPTAIIREFYVLLFVKKTLLHHLKQSLWRLVAGYVLAVAAGVLIGTLLGTKRILREMFSPSISFLIAIPTIAWVPVLLITMGLGNKTVVTAIFLGGVFEVIYSTIVGIRSVQPRQINAARIMGAGDLSVFFKVLMPASLVYILPAMRLSVGYCWRALVGAEMLSAMIQWGIGKMIYEARFWNDVKIMFVGLVTIGILGVLMDQFLLKRLEESTVVKWGMLSER